MRRHGYARLGDGFGSESERESMAARMLKACRWYSVYQPRFNRKHDPRALCTFVGENLQELLSEGRLAPSSAAARFGGLRVAEVVLGRRVFRDASHLFASLPTLPSTTPTDIAGIYEA